MVELVFACCQFCPKQNLIEEVLKLEQTMDIKTLAKSIFEFSNKQTYTCLLTLFNMSTKYLNRTGKFPDSEMPMFNETELTAFFLIKMAEDNNLNMVDILNWTADNGKTLFSFAARYYESLAKELLKKNVVVTTVDNLFRIPSFRVS